MGNDKARWVIIVGVIVFLLMGLFPPWYVGKGGDYISYVGYALIFSPPPNDNILFPSSIDTTRLAVQWLTVVVATVGVYWFVRGKKE